MTKYVLALAAALAAGLAHAQVEVKNAWVRGMVPTQSVTGAFMRITSKTDAKLVGVKTPVAGMAELHRTTSEGGMMHMSPVNSIPLPAGKPVDLAPGGYHVMMMHVSKPLTAGETVPMTLIVEEKDGKRESIEIKVPVKPLNTR
ncbi:MAG: copper chaperone PCu(A)C [Burkholderiales bacterium]